MDNATGPPGGWDSLLNLIKDTNERTKTLETEIKGVKSKLTNFKSEISGRMADLEQKHEELVNDIDRRFDDIKEEVLMSVSEEVATKLREWKDSIKAEILAELKSDQVPSNTERDVSFDVGKSPFCGLSPGRNSLYISS